MEPQKRLKLTALMVQDQHTGTYSGFFQEFSQAVAYGETKQALFNNMLEAFDALYEMNKEIESETIIVDPKFGVIEKREYEFDLAS